MEALKVKTEAGVTFGFMAGIALLVGTTITGAGFLTRLALVAGCGVTMYVIDKFGQAHGWKPRVDR